MENLIKTHLFTLPKLPYALDGLAPFISAETLEFHYRRHHQAYIDNLNRFIQDTPLAQLSLKDIMLRTEGSIFNNRRPSLESRFLLEKSRAARSFQVD